MCKSTLLLKHFYAQCSHKQYPLCEPGGREVNFHLVNEYTIVVISQNGLLSLYTLRELDGSPQRRTTYLLPNLKYRGSSPFYVIHSTPPFPNTRLDLIPGYVPSLQSRIMVLEVLSDAWPVILVIDMAICLEQAIHSETLDEIPWSNWGPQHTCCFPHHPSHRIGVFGSKMAYALPRHSAPEPGERVEGLSTDHDYFFVHIWDFNKRAVARAENTYDCSSSGALVRKPGRLAQSCFVGDVTSDHPYTATVCRTPFKARFFDRLFLEQDRFILTWVGVLNHGQYIAMVNVA